MCVSMCVGEEQRRAGRTIDPEVPDMKTRSREHRQWGGEKGAAAFRTSRELEIKRGGASCKSKQRPTGSKCSAAQCCQASLVAPRTAEAADQPRRQTQAGHWWTTLDRDYYSSTSTDIDGGVTSPSNPFIDTDGATQPETRNSPPTRIQRRENKVSSAQLSSATTMCGVRRPTQ